MSALVPRRAMVLAAGLGTRMRPITEHTPKPLVRVAGKPLIDWGLDALAAVGVESAVVNVHHLGAQIVRHVAARKRPRVTISDESDGLLDSGGGIVKALPLLGAEPFFLVNADTFWIDRGEASLKRLALAWEGSAMDILLMLSPVQHATGHTGGTDFLIAPDGRLRRARNDPAGLVYAGAAILQPRIFAGAEATPHSLNAYFDRAISESRLYGMALEGSWITVGTPDAIAPAEAAVRRALSEER